MADLKNSLKSELKGSKKLAVLGVGSDLRADDNAGMLAAEELEKSSKAINKYIQFKVFFGHTAPENLSGEIRKFEPDHVVIIDAADMEKKPGEISVFTPENAGGISFSTHKLPIKVLAQYLSQSFECRVIIIGIQPKTLDFGKDVSKEVKKAVGEVGSMIIEVLTAGKRF
jgi:hydrogenase 3 maturation protease